MRSNEFNQAVADLVAANKAFMARTLTSVQHGVARENAICRAVVALAADMGTTLEAITHFTSRAELEIVGDFSEEFAAALTANANPRTGYVRGVTMTAGPSWCFVNHFDAEGFVLAYVENNC